MNYEGHKIILETVLFLFLFGKVKKKENVHIIHCYRDMPPTRTQGKLKKYISRKSVYVASLETLTFRQHKRLYRAIQRKGSGVST